MDVTEYEEAMEPNDLLANYQTKSQIDLFNILCHAIAYFRKIEEILSSTEMTAEGKVNAIDKIIHALHPDLYTLVAELCQAKGIPMPRSGGAGK